MKLIAERSGPASSRAELWPLGLVLVVATGARLAWWSLELQPFLDPDSVGYLVPGFDLVTGGQLSLGLRRTPGYPLFCALGLTLSGAMNLSALLALQHVIGVGTAGLTYLIGRLLFGRPAALLAGLLVGLDGGLLLFEHTVMTEALSAFLLVLSSFLMIRGLMGRRLDVLLAAGLTLGLLTLVRPSAQALLLPALAGCLWLLGPRRWHGAALLVAGFGLLVTPWLARNWLQFGTLGLAGNGRFLVHRTLTDDDLFSLWAASGLPVSSDPLRNSALQILLEEDRKREPESATQRFRRELSLGEEQADPIMRDLALGAIAANPLHYLRTTAGLAYQIVASRPLEVSDYWRPYREVGWPARLDFLLPTPRKDHFPEAQRLAGIVDPGRFGPLLGVLFLVGVGAAWRESRSRVWLLPASMVIVSVLFTAALAGLEWRFRFGLDPLLLLGAATGALAVVRLVGEGLARWRAARPSARALQAR